MGIDPILAGGIDAPNFDDTNRLTKMLALKTTQSGYEQGQAKIDRENKLREYYTTADRSSPTHIDNVYRIDPSAGQDLEKSHSEIAKARAAAKKDNEASKTDAFKRGADQRKGLIQGMSEIVDHPKLNRAMAVSVADRFLNQGLIEQAAYDEMVSDLSDDPEEIRADLRSGIQSLIDPKDKMTDERTRSEGKLDRDGRMTVAQMTDARQKSEGSLDRNNQLAIADRADARATAKLEKVKTSDKIASARLEETLQKTSKADKTRFSEIDTALRDIDRLENLTMGENPSVSTGPLGQYANNPFSADKQEVDKIQKKLANQILQEAKGAQTEGDAVRAERLAAITNMSDPTERLNAMRRELTASRENAAYAVQNAAERVDEVRAMGGRVPMGGSPAPATQNQAALEWLRANPNDPRAAAIKAKLGVQ